MISMTGFGKAQRQTKSGTFIVEVSSVNNRYLEISPRLPRSFFTFEPKIRNLVKSELNRGKINIFINVEDANSDNGKYTINKKAAKAYFNQLSVIKKELKLSGEISINDLVSLPDITRSDYDTIDEAAVWTPLKKVIVKALKDLVSMRQKEGDAILKDMTKRIKILDSKIKKIDKLTDNATKKYRDRLNERLNELLDNPLPDNMRIEEEIAMLAERADISEECTRFESHLVQYKDALKLKVPVGKKLNFILQELNREANTIASKSSDIEISSNVIVVKEEIEKLREQVQNIE